MPLDKDNKSHRDFSVKLDDKYSGGATYDKFVRPVIHGTYHAGRFINSGNPEEWARSKDQFSKVGTGQQRTEYLAEHRALQAQEAKQAQQAKQAKQAQEAQQAQQEKK